MLQSLLGLVPEAFEHRLRIVRPTLPTFVNMIELRGLRVGQRPGRPRFKRTSKGVTVSALQMQGELDIVVKL